MNRKKIFLGSLIMAVLMMAACADIVDDSTSIEASAETSVEEYTGSTVEIDSSTLEENVTNIDPATGVVNEEDEPDGPILSFATVDLNGNEVSNDTIKDCKIVMLNFWESWCGPCVRELPELDKLYQDYKDKGFLIIGAYSEYSNESDIKDVVNDTGVTYPIIAATEEMYSLMTDYVPTTVFLDAKGHVLTDEPFVGSNDYEGWEEIVKLLLE